MPIKVHIPEVGAVNFPDEMSPDEIHSTVDSIYSQHLAANPPAMPAAPNPIQTEIDTKSANPMAGFPGGTTGAPFVAGPKSLAAAGLGIGAAGAVVAGPAAIPVIAKAGKEIIRTIPYVAAAEGINYARQNLPLGKYIPPGSELLPLLLAGGRGSSPAAEAGAAEEAATATKATSTAATRQKLGDQLNQALDAAPPLKPNVPLRQQLSATAPKVAAVPSGFTAAESTALKGYRYNPGARELEIVTPNGGHYIYGDIDAQQAVDFANSESAGQAWNVIRQSGSPLVAKVINGKRIPVKPLVRSGSLSDLLTGGK